MSGVVIEVWQGCIAGTVVNVTTVQRLLKVWRMVDYGGVVEEQIAASEALGLDPRGVAPASSKQVCLLSVCG